MAEVYDLLCGFHDRYITGDIPPLLSDFDLHLFNTLRAAMFPDRYPIDLTKHSDSRGDLVECVRSHGGQGQTFVSTTHPGITRGEHFHLAKIERFVVLRGRARISLRRLLHDGVVNFDVSGDEPCVIDMPTLWAHNITNTGSEELVTLFWTNTVFDPRGSGHLPGGRWVMRDRTGPMKVLTVVGTRPEIIRLSRVISRLEEEVDHRLVHTGQNWDPQLSDVFFKELGIRQPDYWLDVPVTSVGAVLGGVLTGIEPVLLDERPDAVLVLGDTNSCLAAVIAKRLGIPVFHMEAGNRCFDENVPEEVNRRIIDHVADFNLCYTEHARRNLLAEGLPGSSHLRDRLSDGGGTQRLSRSRSRPQTYFVG